MSERGPASPAEGPEPSGDSKDEQTEPVESAESVTPPESAGPIDNGEWMPV